MPPPQARPPPDNPPAYSRVIARVYTQSLRPVVLFVTFLSFIWALGSAISLLRSRNVDFETSKRKLYFLIIAILFFVVVGIELFGIFATWRAKLNLVRIYTIGSFVALAIAVGAEIFRLVVHFITKAGLSSMCYKGNTVTSGNLTESQARDLCDNRFDRGTAYDIGWLIAALIFGIFFTLTVAAFYQQLLNPSLLAYTAPSNIPLQHGPWVTQTGPYYGPPPGPPPEERDPPFIPPTAYNYQYDNSSTPGFTPGFAAAGGGLRQGTTDLRIGRMRRCEERTRRGRDLGKEVKVRSNSLHLATQHRMSRERMPALDVLTFSTLNEASNVFPLSILFVVRKQTIVLWSTLSLIGCISLSMKM
ncbi:hypothetical protein BT69DRAFT_1362486 [Atractiella rhizophila]|nr:hypothetical protein BT69DRAFT_1362486 [Atractiella rhizophila]